MSNTLNMLVRVRCDDLAAAIGAYVSEHGLRVDTIFPADAPRVAELSLPAEPADQDNCGARSSIDQGLTVELSLTPAANSETTTPPGLDLEANAETATDTDTNSAGFEICRATAGDWGVGRAEMQYRDLVPSRLGGRLIASQIRIPVAGPVPDSVHFHEVGFQLIFCLSGWVRLVYEDQGEPFVLRSGDAILQAPTQRHRVLESSAGLEVLEVSSPSEHPTRFDHDLDLPNGGANLGRSYVGQPYVHFVANDAEWVLPQLSMVGTSDLQHSGEAPESLVTWQMAPTGISAEAGHHATVSVLRSQAAPDRRSVDVQPLEPSTLPIVTRHECFAFVLQGSGSVWASGPSEAHPLTGEPVRVGRHDSFVLRASTTIMLASDPVDPLHLVWISLHDLTEGAPLPGATANEPRRP